MRLADWDRLRPGIALKTFTALIKKYQDVAEIAHHLHSSPLAA